MNPAPIRVPVDLAGRSYEIIIGRGLLAEIGSLASNHLAGRRALIVTDGNVATRHLSNLEDALSKAGIAPLRMILPAGEKTKSWPFLEAVAERAIAEKLERGDLLIALGGGVIGDLVGFAAAIVRRGMSFIQIPTSLLAQVDSSVGGKTGINSPLGKNLIGAFHQPVLVLADSGILDTLSEREFRAGYAEVVKYGLIDQPAFFEWLDAGAWQGIFKGGPEREEAIRVSCSAKAAIVARDETETGDRALLNLGHTFGHALEALNAYDSAKLVHGEAVAIGISQAHRFSTWLGLCPETDTRRVESHFKAVGLPTRVGDIPNGPRDAEAILTAIRQDKKVSRGTLTFILTRGIGRSEIVKGVDAGAVQAFLEQDLLK